MKRLFILILFIISAISASAQSWTAEQLSNANTAKDIAYLTQAEKDAIMYINLARLYPKLFVEYELKGYNGTEEYINYIRESKEKSRYESSKYKKSLIKELNSREAIPALVFDKELYEDAKCFAAEVGLSGREGHNRVQCEKYNYAECISYGMFTGKDIAMQLLIDHDVPSLGHRKICLDNRYTKIGVSVHDHKKWDTCAVLELVR